MGMKGKKFLASLWLSIATFCLLQILFGPGGLTETLRLQEQNARLENRLAALREENARLTARYEGLRTGSESVRLEARALGYFRPGETPVRTLDGAQFRLPSEEPDLSMIPPLPDQGAASTLFFRIALPLLFVVYYSLFHLMERMWPSHRRTELALVVRKINLPVPLRTGLDFFRK